MSGRNILAANYTGEGLRHEFQEPSVYTPSKNAGNQLEVGETGDTLYTTLPVSKNTC